MGDTPTLTWLSRSWWWRRRMVEWAPGWPEVYPLHGAGSPVGRAAGLSGRSRARDRASVLGSADSANDGPRGDLRPRREPELPEQFVVQRLGPGDHRVHPEVALDASTAG